MTRISARCVVLATTVTALTTVCCHAASVTNWRTYKANTATVLSGQGTDDPVVGDSANPASAAFVIGYLDSPAVLGDDVGDTVTLSFSVSFGDADGMNNAGDNFRFALFDLNGEAQDPSPGSPNFATAGTNNTDNFRGYILGARNGAGAGSGGSIRERIAMLSSGQNAFAVTGANAGTAPSLGSVGGDPVTLASDGTEYRGLLTLTRNSNGLVDVWGSFIGSNAATGNVFSATDLTANTSSTYGAVGFLIGGPLSVDQARFQDVDVTAVPEPVSALLFLSGASTVVMLRRRTRQRTKRLTGCEPSRV